jgi:hypothetical protein
MPTKKSLGKHRKRINGRMTKHKRSKSKRTLPFLKKKDVKPSRDVLYSKEPSVSREGPPIGEVSKIMSMIR